MHAGPGPFSLRAQIKNVNNEQGGAMQPHQDCGRRLAERVPLRHGSDAGGLTDAEPAAEEADSEAAGTLLGVGNSRPAPLNLWGFVDILIRSGKDNNTESREFLHRSARPHLPPWLEPPPPPAPSSPPVRAPRLQRSPKNLQSVGVAHPNAHLGNGTQAMLAPGGAAGIPPWIAAEQILTTEANDRSAPIAAG